MFKQLKGQKGFTLIELMIVVAIIGILAAIAIPNFLTYQLKSRQSEAKTNLQAIKTSAVAFQSERGCYVGVTTEGVASPVAAVKTTPIAWGAGLPPTAPGALWCTAVFNGFFNDVGFRPAGNVNYLYGLLPATVAAPGIYTQVTSCVVGTAALANGAVGVGAAGNNNFVAVAQSNLDGDAVVSAWDSALDHGANDCTTGVF
jgi:type IV pilus assembly protein PilA